ncbi:hypothetical protein BY458DRAFT_520206 [Sporodiniella umbellata]|nr:hypothetical protein BY458DRAFT_520206 [Sporodiniella umbellata]
MSLFSKSIYAYNPDDIIDLDGVLNEGSSQVISLSSIDDQQLNELTRALVTPTPNSRYHGQQQQQQQHHHHHHHHTATNTHHYPESVLLFRDLKHDRTTIDLVESDLKDFMGHYDMDDLASKAPTRIENPRLNELRRVPSSILQQRRSYMPPSKMDKKSQLLSAIEKCYAEPKTNVSFELGLIEQLKELDPKAYEQCQRDIERQLKRLSLLLQHFRKVGEPQKSGSNSTTSTSSHSNDGDYDPPVESKPKHQEVYPQDSISSSNEPLAQNEAKHLSKKQYQAQQHLMRSASQEERQKRRTEEERQKRRTEEEEKRRVEEERREESARNKPSPPRRSLDYSARRPFADKTGFLPPSGIPRKSIEETTFLPRSHLRRSSEEARRSIDLTHIEERRPHRRSVEETKAKVDSLLRRPRRNTDESKTDPPIQPRKSSNEPTYPRSIAQRHRPVSLQPRRPEEEAGLYSRRFSYRNHEHQSLEDIKKRHSYQEKPLEKSDQGEKVKESARKVLAMVQERRRMKRLGIQSLVHS